MVDGERSPSYRAWMGMISTDVVCSICAGTLENDVIFALCAKLQNSSGLMVLRASRQTIYLFRMELIMSNGC